MKVLLLGTAAQDFIHVSLIRLDAWLTERVDIHEHSFGDGCEHEELKVLAEGKIWLLTDDSYAILYFTIEFFRDALLSLVNSGGLLWDHQV